MYTTKDISEIIGWTPRQIYDRMKQIDDFMESFTQRGKKNKILVNNKGFKILRRLNDLENDDLAIKEAAKRVREVLINPDDKGTGKNDFSNSKEKLLESYKKQVTDLKRQIQEKDKLINWFQEVIREGLGSDVRLTENEKETNRTIEYPH